MVCGKGTSHAFLPEFSHNIDVAHMTPTKDMGAMMVINWQGI